jgi:hypothetical protein
MNQEKNMMSAEPVTALLHQYNAGCAMLNQTNTRRTATARFFISLSSGLIGLLTIVLRLGADSETQLIAINIISVIAIALDGVWYITVQSLRHLAAIQRTLLKEMEEMLPFAFITRQEQMMQRSSGWLNTGNIEQYLPLAMIIPPVLILAATNLG